MNISIENRSAVTPSQTNKSIPTNQNTNKETVNASSSAEVSTRETVKLNENSRQLYEIEERKNQLINDFFEKHLSDLPDKYQIQEKLNNIKTQGPEKLINSINVQSKEVVESLLSE